MHSLFFAMFVLTLISCKTTTQTFVEDMQKSEVCTTECAQRLSIGDSWITYYSSHPFDTNVSVCIKRAIIVVHGANRNGDDYFGYMTGAVARAGKVSETLVIAPHFRMESDNPEPGELYWSSQGWRKGNLDLTGQNLSTYDYINKFMDIIISDFPFVEEIILTGHSAGGQLTQRFAAISSRDLSVPVRYIPANVGSYLYLDEYRPTATGIKYPWFRNESGDLELIADYSLEDSSCERTFNDYKYGLEQRNTMGLDQPASLLRERYVSRDITYFLGDADIEINEWVDTSCDAMLQGPNRYERGLSFVRYLKARYPEASSELVVVPGVAHSARQMYQSDEGLKLLFK